MPLSLFDDLKRSGFHSSILTTFSVDPAFYDANIQNRLRSFACRNNLLMADSSMLEQALEQMPEAFVQAGRKYLIVPISGKGCFHPKIILRYGKSKARLLLGSANATSAGWGSNREVLSALDWSHDPENAGSAVHLGLIAKAHDWLMARLPALRDPDLGYKLDLLETLSPWLADMPRMQGAQRLEDDSLIDLLFSDPDAASGLGDALIGQVEGEVERLVIVSPYWDDGLGALRRLHAAFGSPPVHVFLSLAGEPRVRQSTFPISALTPAIKVVFHPLGDRIRHRFLHAKVIMAQTKDHDYLLYGSANCTIGALGTRRAPGVNCEAAIFRRLRRGTVDRELDLGYSREIPLEDIAAPEKEPAASSGPTPFHPGRIEVKGDRLIWSYPDDISPAGAHFLIGGQRYKVEASGGMRPHVSVSRTITEATVIVRVELSNGRVSRPVIVSDPDILKAAAPNPLAGNLKNKLDAVLSGAIDLIEIARDVHLIFEQDAASGRKAAASSSGGGSSISASIVGRDYDSPEAFRQALGFKSDLYSSSIAHPDNPALQVILQIVLNGIVELEGSDSIDRSDTEAATILGMGEDQDDVGSDDNAVARASPKVVGRLGPAVPIDRKIFERNRVALTRSIARFENYVGVIAASGGAVDFDFVTRTLFMIYLMLYGSSRPYTIEGSPAEVLIPFSGIGTDEQAEGFLLRAARLMRVVWGTSFKRGLMARIPLDRELEILPAPVLTLVILTRWILAAILHEARSTPSAKGLAAILENTVPQVFVATSAFALTDPQQIETAIGQMARHIGMNKLQASAIQKIVAELS
ncbi:hypothetical protein [Agrobacterium rosae]|uniref:Phospholipase D-like domain-containing protein n=1 Tax=Agrobacterium rosae TaxID=1972867 RepID=A0A1R3U0W2_9HYPH|nr:hypothetical protein [Agrobacterium rosae]SCX34552.1 hypothetical protein DSM25559_4510 [Agrobacterium rosae]